MVDGKARRPGHVTRWTIGHGNLVNHLFIVQCHNELVGLVVMGVVNASVGYGLVHEGEVEGLVVLVEQQPVVESAWSGAGERQSDHVPAVTLALPLAGQVLQRPQVFVAGHSNPDGTFRGLELPQTPLIWHGSSASSPHLGLGLDPDGGHRPTKHVSVRSSPLHRQRGSTPPGQHNQDLTLHLGTESRRTHPRAATGAWELTGGGRRLSPGKLPHWGRPDAPKKRKIMRKLRLGDHGCGR
jgi:hypothetical protein